MYNKNALYDTFNAKYLSYMDVATSFIPNDEYMQLLSNNHNLIMGPRGCGKTTLLKMLTPAALHYWKNDEGEKVKELIPFTAIYIPSDIQWKSQQDFLNKYLDDKKELSEKIAEFLITINIQIALCRTFNALIQVTNTTNQEKLNREDSVCRGLIDIWDLARPITPSFDDLELTLQKRVSIVNSLVSSYIFKREKESIIKDLPSYVFHHFFDIVKLGCKVFEQKLELRDNYKWALCFDELEISPKFFQIKLLQYLRSVDQKYLFKLTTTPLFNLENNLVEASQDNDFKTLKLWVYDDSGSQKWRVFCDRLITKRLERRFGKSNVRPEFIFGTYNLDEIIKDELQHKGRFNEGTSEGSSTSLLFARVASTDLSFKKFLESRGIDSDNPFSRNNEEDKSIFLKHKVNILYRYLFKLRFRKKPSIHYGIPYIYDICDGNPRSVIGLIDEIILRTEINRIDENFKISPNKQSEIIMEISKKYLNLIKNHPDSTIIIREKEFNLAKDIIDKIGNFIYTSIVKDDFKASIPTTFTVDSEINQKIIRLLEHALYLGVIVYLDPIESLSNQSLINKRFRLSYLLTPLYRIPNRVNSEINLNTILRQKNPDIELPSLGFN